MHQAERKEGKLQSLVFKSTDHDHSKWPSFPTHIPFSVFSLTNFTLSLFRAAFILFGLFLCFSPSSCLQTAFSPYSSHFWETWRSMEVPLAASAGLNFCVCIWVSVCGRLLLLALWWMMNLEPGCVLETGCASVLWSVKLMPTWCHNV